MINEPIIPSGAFTTASLDDTAIIFFMLCILMRQLAICIVLRQHNYASSVKRPDQQLGQMAGNVNEQMAFVLFLLVELIVGPSNLEK